MKCCSKTGLGLALAAGLGIAVIAGTGVGPAVWNRVTNKFEKQIPPEVQIEQLKIDISKLDKEVDKNWGPIATYEREIKELRGELAKKSDKIKSMDKELAAAADEIEAKVQLVTYEGKKYDRLAASKILDKEVNRFISLKREVASKEKLLSAREQKLAAAMAMQKEMTTQKDELNAQVAQLEADLQTLKLKRTESKLPIDKSSRLDRIKERLSKLQATIGDKTRAEELRESFNSGSTNLESKEKVDLNSDSVVKRVRDVLGNHNVAKDE